MLPWPRIETNRLLLDALRGEDARALHACRSDPEVARYQGWCPQNPQAAADFIAAQAKQSFAGSGQWCQLAVRERATGGLIGDLGLHFPADAEDALEFGISLGPAAQGRGLASEALRAVFDLVFGPWGYRRVVASVDPRNLPSLRLCRALGMRQEAHHVESLRFRGAWVDDVVFALLRREWSAGA